MNGKNEKMRSYSAEASRLRTQIQQTKEEIDAARNHFEQAVDPTLIDCYIYEINAAQLRYQFLLRRFKAAEEAAAGPCMGQDPPCLQEPSAEVRFQHRG